MTQKRKELDNVANLYNIKSNQIKHVKQNWKYDLKNVTKHTKHTTKHKINEKAHENREEKNKINRSKLI